MFTVIGDMIHWDGQPVAVFRRDVIPSMRETVETALDDTLSGPCPDCASFEEDLKAADAANAEKDDECEKLTRELIDAETKRDAYAAMLGIKP